MLKNYVCEDNLIIQKEYDQSLRREISKVFIPPTYIESILTLMHLKLSHPSSYQLQKIFEKYFCVLNLKKYCDTLTKECNICVSLMKLPKQIQKFEPKLFPEHPGTHVNIDVIKRASQNILVCTDMFSKFTTATLIPSESRDAMIDALLLLTTPIRHSPQIVVRVDKAPVFKSLTQRTSNQLEDNGIKLELGEDANKNSNCVVDSHSGT